jgi:hypothetical protein
VYAPVLGDGTRNGLRNWRSDTFNLSFNRFHFQWGQKLLVQDVGYSRPWAAGDGAYQTEYVKVIDLEDHQPSADKIKALSQLFMFVNGITDVVVDIKFSNIPFSLGIDWSQPDYTGIFTTAEDYKLDPQRPGRYMAFRFTTNDTEYHELTSYDLTIEMLGRRG